MGINDYLKKKKKIKIGTRDSKLALKQVDIAINYIKKFYNDIEFEIIKIKTQGDLIKDKPLYEFGGKALFTKEIDNYLLSGRIDIAVHSAKDIDSNYDREICFPMILPRQNPKDALISFKYKSLYEMKTGSIIGTCSLRRKEQIKLLRSDLNFQIIRGNINSRIDKLQNSNEFDAIILASAGLERINLEGYISEEFSFDDMIPCPCQGIISIACLKSNIFLKQALESKTDHYSNINFQIERKFVEEMNASCKSTIGFFSELIENYEKIIIRAIVYNQASGVYKKIKFITKIQNVFEEISLISKDLKRYL
jgi:hydroxymethylbilane synthase